MTIDQFNFAGHKAIVRVDFNVPLDDKGNVTDDPRCSPHTEEGACRWRCSHHDEPHGQTQG